MSHETENTKEVITDSKIEIVIEKCLFASRWLLAPIYFGLIFALILLLIKFFQEIAHISIFAMKEKDLIIAVLTLVDMSLLGNLVIIVIFNGYEGFISKINVQSSEKMDWMGKVGFSTLKVKVISSIIAIASVDLLKVFVNIENYTDHQLKWRLIIYVALVFAGFMLALMDRIVAQKH